MIVDVAYAECLTASLLLPGFAAAVADVVCVR